MIAERNMAYINQQQQPVCLGLNEGEFNKQRYYDRVKFFKNEFYAKSTTLSSNVWEMQKKM